MDESNYIKSKGFLVHERRHRQRLKKDQSRSYWQFQNQQGIPGIFEKVLQIERRQPESKNGGTIQKGNLQKRNPPKLASKLKAIQISIHQRVSVRDITLHL